MSSTREILSFVVETDASKGVAGFQEVEKAADSSLAKTEKSASNLGGTLTKVGAGAKGVGLAVGAGLVGTVKTFEHAEEAANKLDTAVSGMGSDIDTKAIERLAFQLQQVSDVTDDQVVSAARWGAVYGLTTRQLEQLLTAAVDLSAQTGKSLDSTTKALAKAASGGSYTALTKLGLTFDDTAFKADSFGTTISEAMEFAGGAAKKQADTMSGQLDRVGHNWTDVKEKIGAGANEVFEPLARGAANFSEEVASLNPDLLKTIGHVAALGSMGTTAFGGIASLGGQLVNIREGFSGISGVAEKAFSKVGLPIKDAEGATTKFGKALGGAGMALGALGAAAAVTETAVAINEATENTVRFETALNKLGNVTGTKDIGKQLKEMSDSSEGWGDKVVDVFTRIQTIDIGGSVMDVDDLQESLDKLKDSSPEELARVLPTVQKALDGMTNKNPETEKLAGHVKDLSKWLDAQADSSSKAAGAGKEQATVTAEQAVAAEDMADALKKGVPALDQWNDGLNVLAGGGKAAASALDDLVITDDQIENAAKMGQAVADFRDNLGNLPGTIDQTKLALGGYTGEQTKSIDALTQLADQNRDYVSGLITSGASNDEVRLRAAALNAEYGRQMKAAGLTTDQVAEYQRVLGLTDPDVETAIRLSGDAEARLKLQLIQGQMDKLDEGVQAEITQKIIMGDWQGALALSMSAQQAYAAAHPVKVDFKYTYPKDFMGPIPPGAVRVQSAGAVPTGMTVQTQSTGAPQPAGSTSHVTINMPPGTPTSRTLAELRRYRRGGGDMSGLVDQLVAVR